MEQSSYSTVDFLKRAILYFDYQPKVIQTDNGSEFTHIQKTNRIHPLDALCLSLNIEHKLIKPRLLDIMTKLKEAIEMIKIDSIITYLFILMMI